MRTLLLMQGCPGSGKGTWIKENNLEQYTLSPDSIRTMVQPPLLNEEGKSYISQNNDKYVWNLLFQILEERMKRGDFTVIDATHNNDKMIKQYKDLCDTYKYTMFIKRIDTPLEKALEQNRSRDEYKFVPEKAIKLAYDRIQNMKKLSWYNFIDDISEINNFYTQDLNQYDKVFIFGDIHGCIEPLDDFFKENPFNEKYAYIFLGDYIDRGLDNLAVMNKMIELSKYKNVFLLEGNHENVLPYLAKGIDSGKKSFDIYTAPELQSINKSEIKMFYKKLRQCMRITYKNKEYLLTHGGLPTNPKYLTYISTQQLIKGVGGYDFDVDKAWYENEESIIQIHGHRAIYQYPNSISLEGEIEYGGDLKYIELSSGLTVNNIKNNKFQELRVMEKLQDNRSGLHTQNEIINKMSKSIFIKTKKLKDNIVSLNFNENCFNKKAWNDLTIKARGLFVDKQTGNVVARGYEKMFTYMERRETTLNYIKEKYEFPLACYKKYNGYLGIISHKNNELIFFSKTTNEGEKAERFKEIFYKYTTENFRKRLLSILIENDCSVTCEIIDVKNDPHIINSNVDEAIYLLDLIKNELTYNNLQEVFMKEIFLGLLFDEREIYDIKHIQAKEIKEWILSPSELEEWIKKALQENDIEGYVIHSKDNKKSFKLKTNYYDEWRSCRYLMIKINNNNGYFEMRLSQSPLQVQFGKWYSDNFKRLKDINNILILREKFKEETKKC